MNEFNPNEAPRPMMGARPQLGFMEAVKICLKEKYCCFQGRARRSEFWWFVLFQQIVSWVLSPIAWGIYLAKHSFNDYIEDPLSFLTSPGFILLGLVGLALLLPNLGAMVRRLHDTGRTGKWLLIYLAALIPIVGTIAVLVFAIILIVWWCQDSQPQENEYGPSPKYQ